MDEQKNTLLNINKSWHSKNKMPKKSNFEQKIIWHTEHQKNCHCQSAPSEIQREINRRSPLRLKIVEDAMVEAEEIQKKVKSQYADLEKKFKEMQYAAKKPQYNLRSIIVGTNNYPKQEDPSFKKLYLTSSGDLYRNPKDKYLYPLRAGKIRLTILRLLIKNKGFTSTDKIARMTDSKSNDSVRKTIGIINSNAQEKLKLEDRLIESKNSLGYRINSNYKIEFLID